MGEGEFDLFSNWFTEGSALTNFLQQVGVENAPSICVVCSRIKFDDEVKKEFEGKTLSLEYWAQITKPKNKQITYSEYMLDDAHDKELFTPRWIYGVDEPVATVFARVPASQVTEWGKHVIATGKKVSNLVNELIGGFEQHRPDPKKDPGIDLLYLVPLSNVKNVCGVLANVAPSEV